jgi:DNA-binding MarR family transcriptional regulator
MTVISQLTVAASLEQIIFAGVALTTVAISAARPDLDLTFPQWRVLVVLGESPVGMRIGEVSRRVGVTLPATSRQLHRLERRGLIAVSPDDRDRRASRARLTPAGQEAHDAIIAYRRARIAEIAAPFEPDDELRGQVLRLAEAFAGSAAGNGVASPSAARPVDDAVEHPARVGER